MEVTDALSPLPGVVEVKTDPNKRTATVTVDALKFDSKSAIEKLAAANFEDSTVVQ
ncbi:MAG: cation transporter [Pirellulaceae bacterium]|jgi:copper chaperone CopZ|nr:cation transporter [Pirellulaceae bacterium]MDP6555357.1 cation transporter [Pirellulaceae bacterium]MDP6723278.1 cation transporter [Pirellulaceae bacterium]